MSSGFKATNECIFIHHLIITILLHFASIPGTLSDINKVNYNFGVFILDFIIEYIRVIQYAANSRLRSSQQGCQQHKFN